MRMTIFVQNIAGAGKTKMAADAGLVRPLIWVSRLNGLNCVVLTAFEHTH